MLKICSLLFVFRLSLFIGVALVSAGCENANFDKDKRQIAAKDAIRDLLPWRTRNFDVVSFSEDTLASWTDTTVKRPLRYNLNFAYTDSAGQVQNKQGYAMFAPDGKSLLTAQINNR